MQTRWNPNQTQSLHSAFRILHSRNPLRLRPNQSLHPHHARPDRLPLAPVVAHRRAGVVEERPMTDECRVQNAECRRGGIRTRLKVCILHSAFCILVTLSAFAQTNPYTPTTPIPIGYLSLPSSHIAGQGSWRSAQ